MLGLLVLCLFGAVALLGLLIIGVLVRGLREYERRYLSRGSESLGEMFIFIDGRQLSVLTIAVAAVLGLLGLVLFNWYFALLLAIAGFILPMAVIKKLRQRRIRTFDRQLIDGLVQMSAALRAGLSFPQAAEGIADEMPAPLSQEFGLYVKELKLGVSQEEALRNMAERVGSENLALVVTATNVSRQLGGNLAEMYETIATTVRDRFRIEGRVAALTAMGRMQAWVIGAMPLLMGVVFNFMRPDLMEPMLASNFGKGLVAAVIVMEALGMAMIRRIVDIDV